MTMRMTRLKCALGCALLVTVLSGCEREASGQVAAIVNGEEITLQEINAEIGDAELPPNVDRKAVQQAALQRIIDRRLVAQAARKDEIDKDPAYLARQRQANELLLVQMYGQKMERAIRMPEGAKLDKYIADNPTRFADRTIYAIDRIVFPMPSNPQQLEGFRDDHSMAAVASRLDAMGIKYERGNGQLDSAAAPPQLIARLQALPPGEPFLMPQGGAVMVGSIVGSKSAPLTGAEARPIAAQIMRNEEVSKVLQDRVKAARSSAEIEYQEGFAPPKGDASPSPAASPKS